MTIDVPPGWRLEGGSLRCAIPSGDVTLQVQTGSVQPQSCSLPGVDWQLREWTLYTVEAPVPIRAIRGLEDASPFRGMDRRIWSFQLRNRVGRLVFTVDTDQGSTPPFRAEVLSSKFPTPELHFAFLQGLTADLARQTRHADFVPSAPTAFGVATDPRGPSLLSDLNTLLSWGDRVQEAVDSVVGDPHRTLSEVDERRRLVDLTSVPPQLLPQLVSTTGQLQSVPPEWPLAAQTGGLAPEWIVLPIPEETLDTSENRFVVMVLQVASDALERLRATPWVWNAIPQTSQNALTSLASRLDHVCATTFLGELEPAPLPHSSQVLARRPAYRAVWDFWHYLTSGRRSMLAEADQAIANRDIAALYELWAFFALCDVLSQTLGPVERWEGTSDERSGVRYGAMASFAQGWSLSYNRELRRPKAYGVTVRPDYLLQRDYEPRIAFDAKFRFDIPGGDEEQYVEDDDPAMTAVSSDLIKMHAYRDALDILSAVVVFPGNQDRMFTVAPERGERLGSVAMEHIITGAVKGVGAIHLRPQA